MLFRGGEQQVADRVAYTQFYSWKLSTDGGKIRGSEGRGLSTSRCRYGDSRLKQGQETKGNGHGAGGPVVGEKGSE